MSVRKIQYKLHEYESAPKSALPSVAEPHDAPDSGSGPDSEPGT
jgi:hypothetical protein